MVDQPTLSIAVAIPAYNEEGLPQFLQELDDALAPVATAVSFHIVDDVSPSDMVVRVRAVADSLRGRLEITSNERNSGHGPTVLNAYKRALAATSDVVVQVDGDGQFFGADLLLLLEALERGAEIATGVRTSREDPWFRRALSFGLRGYLFALAGVAARDPNCPFRAYRADVLREMIDQLPSDALVPSVYLTALAHRRGYRIDEVAVRHRVRLGESAQGTMWGRRRALFIPRRLLVFVGRALVESLRLGRQLRRTHQAGHRR